MGTRNSSQSTLPPTGAKVNGGPYGALGSELREEGLRLLDSDWDGGAGKYGGTVFRKFHPLLWLSNNCPNLAKLTLRSTLSTKQQRPKGTRLGQNNCKPIQLIFPTPAIQFPLCASPTHLHCHCDPHSPKKAFRTSGIYTCLCQRMINLIHCT